MVVIVLLQLAMVAHLALAREEGSVEQHAKKRTIKAFNIGILGRTYELNPV